MIEFPAAPSLLHVASPYARNTQQRVQSPQQSAQQAATLPSLKALAIAALTRNNPRNNDATTSERVRNSDAGSVGSLLNEVRTRLLSLAASEGLPASIVETIPDDELPDYAAFDDADLLLPLHLRARCSLCGGKRARHIASKLGESTG